MTPATAVPTLPPTAQPATYSNSASLARFSLASYQQMIEAGILGPDDAVELLENYLVLKMPRNTPHDSTIHRLIENLLPVRPRGWTWRVQLAITLSDSQPEPDFALVRGTSQLYEVNHPGPGDAGILIEVADSSLQRDRIDKARIYARAGIPVYWIVNLVDRRVEAHSQPSGSTASPAYGATHHYFRGDDVPLVLDGTVSGTVPAADLLP